MAGGAAERTGRREEEEEEEGRGRGGTIPRRGRAVARQRKDEEEEGRTSTSTRAVAGRCGTYDLHHLAAARSSRGGSIAAAAVPSPTLRRNCSRRSKAPRQHRRRSSTALDVLWRRIADLALNGGADEEEGGKRTRRRRSRRVRASERRGARVLGFLKLYTATEGMSSCGAWGCSRLQAHRTCGPSHPDRRARRLCKWSQPGVIKHRPQLAGLVSDKQFRETLTLAVDPALDNTMPLPSARGASPSPPYSTPSSPRGAAAAPPRIRCAAAAIFAFFCAFSPDDSLTS